jgi:hypothetical protein
MNSAASVSSLSIPLISGYGLGILRVSSDQKPITEIFTTKTQPIKKNQTGITTLVLNVAGHIPPLITRRIKIFHLFTSEFEVELNLDLIWTNIFKRNTRCSNESK